MTETSEERPQGMPRRKFLKLVAAAVPAVIGIGNEVVHEKQLAENGFFETADARWFPIY